MLKQDVVNPGEYELCIGREGGREGTEKRVGGGYLACDLAGKWETVRCQGSGRDCKVLGTKGEITALPRLPDQYYDHPPSPYLHTSRKRGEG